MEGVISKLADAPYENKRSRSWLKTKCHKRQEFVIGGFTLPTHAQRGVGALLIGYYEEEQLTYAGKVGTGLTMKPRCVCAKNSMPSLARKKPFTSVPADGRNGCALGEPATRLRDRVHGMDGRRPVYAIPPSRDCAKINPLPPSRATYPYLWGKPAAKKPLPEKTETKKAPASPKEASGSDMVGGIKVTHPDRVIYPGTDITKAPARALLSERGGVY